MKSSLLFFALLASFRPPSPALALSVQWTQETPSTPVSAGLELIQSGKLWEALEQFARAKAASPSDDKPYYYSGVALLKLGRLREAAAELAKASRLRPDSPQSRLLHAEVLLRLGHISGAVEALSPYEDDQGLAALDAASLWALSDLYFRLDRFDGALRALEKLRPRQPDNPKLLQRRGEVLLALSRFDEADEAFQSALALAPDSSAAHYGIGLSAWRRRDLETARRHLELAHQQEPNIARYAYQLGLVLIDLEELEAARQVLEQVEPAGEQIPEVFASLARIHRRLGNRELARQYRERFEAVRRQAQASKEEARQAERLLAQATSELQSGRVAQARDLLDQVLEVDIRNATAHAYLAKIYLSSKRWREARTHLQQLESIRGDDFEVNYLWADLNYQQGQPELALSRAQAASRLRPADGEIYNLLGNIFTSLGRYNEALGAYQKAVELAPDRPEFKLNLEATRRRLQR